MGCICAGAGGGGGREDDGRGSLVEHTLKLNYKID